MKNFLEKKSKLIPFVFIGSLLLFLFIEYFRFGEFYLEVYPEGGLLDFQKFFNTNRLALWSAFSLYLSSYLTLSILSFKSILGTIKELVQSKSKKIYYISILLFICLILFVIGVYIFYNTLLFLGKISITNKIYILTPMIISILLTFGFERNMIIFRKSIFIIVSTPFIFLIFNYLSLLKTGSFDFSTIPSYPIALGIFSIELIFYIIEMKKH